MTPQAFICHWQDKSITECQGAQSHFIDLCGMLGVERPCDPENLKKLRALFHDAKYFRPGKPPSTSPGPVYSLGLVILHQPFALEHLARVGCLPFPKSAVCRTSGTYPGGVHYLPVASGAQHKQNRFRAWRSGTRGLWRPKGCSLRGGRKGFILVHKLSGTRQPSPIPPPKGVVSSPLTAHLAPTEIGSKCAFEVLAADPKLRYVRCRTDVVRQQEENPIHLALLSYQGKKLC